MSEPAPHPDDALAVHLGARPFDVPVFDVPAFSDVAWSELAAHPFAAFGRCLNPACSQLFTPPRSWSRYCCAACRRLDEAEFRRIGHKVAPALLAHRMGKYERVDPALRNLSAAARRFIGDVQTQWLGSRNARILTATRGQE